MSQPVKSIVQCGHNATISAGQQTRAATELDLLPADSTLGAIVVPDWLRMRDENRACAAAAAKS